MTSSLLNPRAYFCALCTCFLVACGDEESAPRSVQPAPAAPSAALCTAVDEGCSCSEVGSEALCGIKREVSDGYTVCETGARTCQSDGIWSTCKGNGEVTRMSLAEFEARGGTADLVAASLQLQ